jgi:hypothetical protein
MIIKLNTNRTFENVPEGERVLTITKAEVTPSGKPTTLRLTLTDSETKRNVLASYKLDDERSLYPMSVMICTALNLESGSTFDIADAQDLVGHTVLCEVIHKEWNEKTFANIGKVIANLDNTSNVTTNISDDLADL